MLTLLGDRHAIAPYGVFGGSPGAVGQSLVVSKGTTRSYGSKEVVTLHHGDIVSLRTSGAGGYGNPSERDPSAIHSDLADGYVTPAAAEASYGRTLTKNLK
jgi:N-methylhydantoinase B